MTDPEEQQDRSSLMPILVALGVVVLVLIGFGVSKCFRGDGLTPELRVARAAIGQNDALQRSDYTAFRNYTCAAEQGTESEVLARQHQSTTAKGARFVDDVTAVPFNGEQGHCPDGVHPAGRGVEGLFARARLAVGHSRA